MKGHLENQKILQKNIEAATWHKKQLLGCYIFLMRPFHFISFSSCEYLCSFFILLRVWRKVEICSRFVLIRSKQKVGFHTECAPQLFYWTPHARCLIEIDDKGDKSNNSLELKTQTNTHQLDQFWNFLYPWKIVISRVKGVDVRSATRVLKAATMIFLWHENWNNEQIFINEIHFEIHFSYEDINIVIIVTFGILTNRTG